MVFEENECCQDDQLVLPQQKGLKQCYHDNYFLPNRQHVPRHPLFRSELYFFSAKDLYDPENEKAKTAAVLDEIVNPLASASPPLAPVTQPL